MSTFDYDLFVIGGGSGGVRAGRMAAETGAKVALAEESRMGGTCVIRGCVPKKLMVFASGYGTEVADAREYGWDFKDFTFDWPRFQKKLAAELDRLEGVYETNYQRPGGTLDKARASLKDPHTIALSTGEEVSAKHILVATGGRPYVPHFPGCELAITSNDVFDLPALPGRLLIVGGGYIACEFATIFKGLGSHVAQWYRGAQILRGFDDEVRGHLAELISGHGVDLHVGLEVAEMEKRGKRIWVKGSDGREDMFDQVLYATGRKPNTGGLGLEAAGGTLGRRGQGAGGPGNDVGAPASEPVQAPGLRGVQGQGHGPLVADVLHRHPAGHGFIEHRHGGDDDPLLPGIHDGGEDFPVHVPGDGQD